MRRRLAALAVAGLATVAAAVALAGEPAAPPGPAAEAPATLAQLWDGDARWTLAHKWTGTQLGQADPYSGAHVEVVGDRWYLFNRTRRDGLCAGSEPQAGLQVRESADRGATWSAPVPILEPTAGTPWACVASDGDAFYDAEADVWRYLFQCKADATWHGCYAERRGASPMGPFEAPPGIENPVIRSGELWREICDPGDDCARRPLVDEGTFNLFERDGEGFWLAFHGSDGTNGYRGVARTADFRSGSFEVDRRDDGLPGDAILGPADAAGFNESWATGGPVAAGAGSIVREGDHYYALNEFSDTSLRCTPGQNWDLGLFRTEDLADRGWEPFPGGNPVVYSSRAPEAGGQAVGCNVLYPGLFRDEATGTWYLAHGRATTDAAHNAIYVYRLVEDPNLLVNGDLARGDATGWTRLPSAMTTLEVPRLPNLSADGSAFLRFGCAAACPESFHQDVEVPPAAAGRRLAFGGVFSGPGRLELVIHQLDGRRRLLHSDTVAFSPTSEWAAAGGEAAVREGAQVLRFEVYAQTPGPFGADGLFLRVAGST